MARGIYIEKISHRILFLGGVVYIINYLLDGVISGAIAMNPELVLQWELWRMITFPFSSSSLEGILLFGFTFYIIGPKVEQYIGRFIFPLIISLLVLIEGIILTLVFWKENIVIGGMEGISFFVLTFYSLLYFGKKSDLSNFRPSKARMLVSLVAFAWVGSLLMRSYMIGSNEILVTNAVSATIGFVGGLLLFIQLWMLRKVIKQKRNDYPDIDIPKPEELSMAMIAQREKRKYLNEPEDNSYYENNFTFTEDRLNEILIKSMKMAKPLCLNRN